MKHVFKKGDGVIFDSVEECQEMAFLLNKKGYSVFSGTLNGTMCSRLTYVVGSNGQIQFSGTDGKIRNTIPKNKFLELITENKKIIGYKAPIDLFNGTYKAGTIFTTLETYGYYQPQGCWGVTGSMVPKEIVETWEPVFEKETFKAAIIGSKNKKINVYKDGIIVILSHDDVTETTTIQMVKAILEDFTIRCGINNRVIGTKWKIEIASDVKFIRIGCITENNLFSINELTYIVSIYNSLQN